MTIEVYKNPQELGKAAATEAARLIREAVVRNGTANIILATGTSQFETLRSLVAEDIEWSKVCMFHLDEYIGLPITHAASFRNYLHERFISKVSLQAAYLINGEANPKEECNRLNHLITQHPIDVALVGIGENGHLAFNDPPADFTTEEPYIIVELNEACRKQQLGEGWFGTLEEVPQTAISMSIKQIMKSKYIVCSVPHDRKAVAVSDCLNGEISPLHPASILQAHTHCTIYLDADSASLLHH